MNDVVPATAGNMGNYMPGLIWQYGYVKGEVPFFINSSDFGCIIIYFALAIHRCAVNGCSRLDIPESC
jgi:hypothetical protein